MQLHMQTAGEPVCMENQFALSLLEASGDYVGFEIWKAIHVYRGKSS